jgi:xanthine dehydrogenase accessory factor
MNHWKESAEVLSRLEKLAAAGGRAALATVVGIAGSAYRRPGAKLLIEEAGGTVGSVSGGCLEADVREVAKAVLETGVPSLRHYNTGDEDIVFGLGLGCNGLVDVFVQPATEGPLAAFAGRLRALLAGDAPFALATVVAADEKSELGRMMAVEEAEAGEGAGSRAQAGAGAGAGTGAAADAGAGAGAGAGTGAAADPGAGAAAGSAGPLAELGRQVAERARGLLPAGRSTIQQVAGRGVFVEVLAPPPHLLVCGAGDDARPLVAYAADAGFRVSLFDHRPALLDAEWFPQAARRVIAQPDDAELALPPAARSLAVVKTHSLAHDREWVRRLLAAGLPYVGILGPRGRAAAILRDIGAEGAPGIDERVFGPVGLDLGADGPRQVALAIVAELLAFVARREPRHLSERREAIHAV